MKATDSFLEFDGRTLTYRYKGGVTTYIGGRSPEFKTETALETKYTRMHQDPDYPIQMFREELYKDVNFRADPIDCTGDGVVLLGSGKDVRLEELPEKEQEWAVRAKHIAAFQRTIPDEIKERLMTIHCCRWAHYEIFTNSQAAMDLFDQDPDLIMKAARSHKRRSLSFNPYV